MIRFMTELFPIVPGPLWMKNQSQPIAVRNVIDYLLAALTNPAGRGGIFEIGGPEIISYYDLMLGYARLRGLKRRILLLPGIPLRFMALGVDWMTPVPYPIAYALIHGLSADSIVQYPQALKIFPNIELIDFQSATREALAKTHPAHIERVWEDAQPDPKSIKHEGCFIDYRETILQAEPEKVFQAIAGLTEERGWIIEAKDANHQRIGHVPNQAGGKKWIEWRVGQIGREASPRGNLTYLAQTVFFCPHGLPGFLHWYLFYPFRLFHFRGLIKSIAKQSETQ
jgi:hypothetical protein